MALSEYKGEEIIAKIIIKGGKKTEERVYMPRTVNNDPAGKDAYIIGNGPSRIGFALYKLPQDSYGCNALHRDYEPDFLIAHLIVPSLEYCAFDILGASIQALDSNLLIKLLLKLVIL